MATKLGRSLVPAFRRPARVLALMCMAIICSAHIGSPDTWYSGAAGPYHLLVHVKAPPVVPGIAIISIKPQETVERVTAFVNKFDAVAGAPPPDIARKLADNPGWYRTQLWVMDPGSNSVTVSVRGASGEGVVVIPLVAVAARRLEFNGLLTTILGAAGLVLVAGMLSVIGAAVRESVLEPGVEPDMSRRKRARFAMLRGALVIVLMVSGLAVWWRAEDNAFAQNMFKPLAVAARVDHSTAVGDKLVLTITDSAWKNRNQVRSRPRGGNEFTTLMTDHDKLMHMFVIAENGQRSFAHLHPTTSDSVTFESVLPPLPAGRYRVFADVLHATGLTETLSATLTLDTPRASANVQLSDVDDAWISSTNSGDSVTTLLADGSSLTWLGARAPHVVGEEADLRFRLDPPTGDNAALEPYLGMSGHAAVVRDDGGVFIHLHPMGTISSAAQTMLSRGDTPPHSMATSDKATPEMSMTDMTIPEMTIPDAAIPAMGAHASGSSIVSFPYAFPTTGTFTVWVQVKRRGRVLTGSFPLVVSNPAKTNAGK